MFPMMDCFQLDLKVVQLWTPLQIFDSMPVLLCKQEIIFICVREEPVVFLHKDSDFVPYTPRRKENLHENLHGLEREEMVEHLELKIRNEVSKHSLKAMSSNHKSAF